MGGIWPGVEVEKSNADGGDGMEVNHSSMRRSRGSKIMQEAKLLSLTENSNQLAGKMGLEL